MCWFCFVHACTYVFTVIMATCTVQTSKELTLWLSVWLLSWWFLQELLWQKPLPTAKELIIFVFSSVVDCTRFMYTCFSDICKLCVYMYGWLHIWNSHYLCVFVCTCMYDKIDRMLVVWLITAYYHGHPSHWYMIQYYGFFTWTLASHT